MLTILEVADALGSGDAADVIDRYVRSIWESWAQHHDTVESWARPFDHSDAWGSGAGNGSPSKT